MKTRFLIAAMSTVLLVGCESTPSTPVFHYHPDCERVQQAEQRNKKDLEAFCFTDATQSPLKCQQAKDTREDLRTMRERMANAIRKPARSSSGRTWSVDDGFGGKNFYSIPGRSRGAVLYDACPQQF